MCAHYVEWNGQRWYKNKRDSYYRNRRGKLLHREKYQQAYGPLSRELHVHHRDGTRHNNALDNLEALTPSEHLRKHERSGFAVYDTEQRRRLAEAQWQARKPVDVVCVGCGTTFPSTGVRAKYCHPNCRARHYKATGRLVYDPVKSYFRKPDGHDGDRLQSGG